jgi:hypothetical protein
MELMGGKKYIPVYIYHRFCTCRRNMTSMDFFGQSLKGIAAGIKSKCENGLMCHMKSESKELDCRYAD